MSIGVGIPNLSLLSLNTSGDGVNRQSVNTNFAGKLRHAARETTLTAQRTANYVAPFVPGAAILSASLGSAAGNLAPDALGGRLQMAAGSEPGAPGGDRGDFLGAMQDMQQNMMSTNMHMLKMQREIQQTSEVYLTASNMMKTKHDTQKNSINNIR